MKRILILSPQGLPLPHEPPTGGGLRLQGLGQALKECGHDVVYALPASCMKKNRAAEDQEFVIVGYHLNEMEQVIRQVAPDILLYSNWGLAALSPDCGIPTVVDMNGILMLENWYRHHSNIIDDGLTKIRAISNSDLILVGSEAQKAYLIGWCVMAGVNPTNIPIAVLPFSLPSTVPPRTPPSEPVFVMAGYDWPWLNVEKTVEIVDRALEDLQTGHLHIVSGPPPFTYFIEGGPCAKLKIRRNIRKRIGSRVTHHSPMGFDELIDLISTCSAAIDISERNTERELAVPARTLIYLWAGLPVIGNDFGELYGFIGSHNAGWQVAYGDQNRLRAIIRDIAENIYQLEPMSSNARQLVKERFSLSETVRPLDQFCRAPVRKSRLGLSLYDQLENMKRTIATDKLRYETELAASASRCMNLENVLEIEQKNLRQQKAFYRQQKALHQQQKAQLEKELTAYHRKNCALQDNAHFMSRVHRRPKGFSLVSRPSLMWRKLDRVIWRMPKLLYLILLTQVGEVLHLLSRRLKLL